MKRIFVNDAPRPMPAEATLSALARELALEGRKGVAAAVNGSVVPRAEWASRALGDSDRVLVIQATQGG
jgi:sulfur carrier protein